MRVLSRREAARLNGPGEVHLVLLHRPRQSLLQPIMEEMMTILKSIAFALLIGGTAMADDKTSPPIYLTGGLICDTLDQAIEQVGKTRADVPVSGCGVLRGNLLGTVTILAPFETKTHRFTMARYDFLSGPLEGQSQFGYWGRPVPTQLGEAT